MNELTRTLTVVTNNVPREVLHWSDLTEEEQAYWSDLLSNTRGCTFFRYNGNCEFLGEFISIDKILTEVHPELKEWDGISSDTAFSGLVIKLYTVEGVYDHDHIIVGRYY